MTFQGELAGIFLGTSHGDLPQAVAEAVAVAGKGLEGDRYFANKEADPEREVTLIEAEALQALAAEDNLQLEASASRRNLLTRGVPLNHLVGREFHVGAVVLRGIRLCEPCGHLEKLTVQGVRKGLCHRGGLRAQVVRGGTVRTGDVIQL